MPSHARTLLPVVAATLLLLHGAAIAAPPPPLGKDMPSMQSAGTLAHYTLTPKGDVDGFVLSDGTQIHLPPHLSTALVYTARPGDAVVVQGHRIKEGPVVEANEVRNQASGLSLIVAGPKDRAGEAEAGPARVDGKVQFTLRGPKGEINGAVLEDGTVLRMPPAEAAKQAARPGAGPDGHCRRPGADDPDGPDRRGEQAELRPLTRARGSSAVPAGAPAPRAAATLRHGRSRRPIAGSRPGRGPRRSCG